MMYVRSLDLKKKENKSAACFVFATTTWSWSRASSLKLPLLCMSMGSRALKKSSNWRSKNLNEKKVSCECSGSILRKLRQKNYCDKNSLLIRAIQSHCGLLTRKRIKRPVTVALPYPFPLHQNEGKSTKKIEIESVFHVFSTTLQKDELFSFWWPYLMPARPPFRPPKPWEWM